MRRFFNIKIQLLLVSLFLLCACSKDNDGIDNTPSIEVGVHKIELSLDGDWKNFNCEFGFVGLRIPERGDDRLLDGDVRYQVLVVLHVTPLLEHVMLRRQQDVCELS